MCSVSLDRLFLLTSEQTDQDCSPAWPAEGPIHVLSLSRSLCIFCSLKCCQLMNEKWILVFLSVSETDHGLTSLTFFYFYQSLYEVYTAVSNAEDCEWRYTKWA